MANKKLRNNEKGKNINLTITYANLWGHAFLAIRFAHFISHCFDIPVKREYKNGEFFELSINGKSVYREKGELDTNQSPLFLIDILSNYAEPVRKVSSEIGTNDNDDPEHREWMHSFCSGE